LTIDGVKVTAEGCGYLESPNTDGFNVQGRDIVIQPLGSYLPS
jgi:hypothetical protein